MALCEQSLALNPTDKHSYFILAMALLGLSRFEEAERALAKVLFLDPNFVEAHCHRAQLLFATGKRRAGLKSLENALTIAEKGDPDRLVHDAPGMTYQRLALILREEFELYSEI